MTDKETRNLCDLRRTEVYVVFDQTKHKDYLKAFVGKDAGKLAKAYAKERSEKGRRDVAVFGPQTEVFGLPLIEASTVKLSFGETT